MFVVKMKHIFLTPRRAIIRTLRNRRQFEDNGKNPGLNKRIRAFQEQGIKIDEDAEEFFETSDSSFYNVGEFYNEHLNETLIGKFDVQHKIVKDKYFKENMPNLLTWSEKEQIRHLATTDPNEWTPERIAESFPVTPHVAKKLLKYPWKPATEERIARHDASAMRNWKELKENTLKIPEDLRKHFLKFSERKIPPLNKKSIKVDLTNTEKIGEFEAIIQRCSVKDKSEKASERKHNDDSVTYNPTNKKNERDPCRMTLEDLTSQIKGRLDVGDQIDMPDKIIVETVSKSTMMPQNNEVELVSEPIAGDLTEYQDENDQIKLYDYPERIRIPNSTYKKGATYKMKDCYYDHDGRFLYRVLGASE